LLQVTALGSGRLVPGILLPPKNQNTNRRERFLAWRQKLPQYWL
jgi:hypothetical protein